MVESASLDGSDGSLESIPSCKDYFSLLSGHLIFTDNDGVSYERCESVKVNTEVNLSNITLVKSGLIFRQRREVAANFINRDADREGDTLLDLFPTKGLVGFLNNELVSELANVVNLGSYDTLFNDLWKNN